MRTIRKVGSGQIADLRWAEMKLREARNFALLGGSDKTAQRIRRALKSIGGAIRHAENARQRVG